MNDVVQLLLALFALAGFLWFAASFVGGLRARRWPTVTGQMLAGDIEESGLVTGSYAWDKKPTYVPRVRYEYTVNGKSYRGDRIRFGGGGIMSRDDALDAVNDWPPVGAPVEVAYDPRDPSNCTLERGPDAANGIWALSFAIAGLILFGGYAGWFTYPF